MSYSLNSSTDNCYEGTSCLINKFDIRDEEQLGQLEAQITFGKAALLEKTPLEGNFDFNHYKKIHEFLFSDLYEWAGTIRTAEISKKRTNFIESKLIESSAERIFSRVKNGVFINLSTDNFAVEIASFYNDINYLHPFREGNGRTQRIYFTQLIRHFGYDINFSETDTDYLMLATIQAANGILDFLIDYFRESIDFDN
ncbi:MAG: Fic family protein [Clostridia bacterium]|nr:Fic family protein [Clostridia bacterium]